MCRGQEKANRSAHTASSQRLRVLVQVECTVSSREGQALRCMLPSSVVGRVEASRPHFPPSRQQSKQGDNPMGQVISPQISLVYLTHILDFTHILES
jgi:hypothetical protein